MTRYFKDSYGGSASIRQAGGRFRLHVRDGHGGLTLSKTYETYRGARAALGRLSDCWKEQVA